MMVWYVMFKIWCEWRRYITAANKLNSGSTVRDVRNLVFSLIFPNSWVLLNSFPELVAENVKTRLATSLSTVTDHFVRMRSLICAMFQRINPLHSDRSVNFAF